MQIDKIGRHGVMNGKGLTDEHIAARDTRLAHGFTDVRLISIRLSAINVADCKSEMHLLVKDAPSDQRTDIPQLTLRGPMPSYYSSGIRQNQARASSGLVAGLSKMATIVHGWLATRRESDDRGNRQDRHHDCGLSFSSK